MIKIKDQNLVGIVLQVDSFQTIVRDLVNQHDIILPNSKLRLARVDVLKTDSKKGVANSKIFISDMAPILLK